MELLEKINENLEPLGGSLFTDSFVAARQAAAAKFQMERRKKVEDASLRAATATMAAGENESSRSRREPAPSEDESNQLQDEVAAFMNRNEPEGTADSEVQEYLKERSGFDPSELE